MEQKTIKIGEENYRWLIKLAAEIQKQQEKPISFNEAITELKKHKMSKLSDLAGAWKISENESKKIELTLKKGWKKWKIKSA